MIFKITSWSLQVMESGTRRLDFDLLPLGHEIVEQVGASDTQRCFVADPDSKKFLKLQEHLANEKPNAPHAQILSATLYDNLAHSPSREYEQFVCGTADFLGIEARVTSSAMDELIRQDSLGHPVFYVEIAIDGIERTTGENNEGRLVDSKWLLKEEWGHKKSRVAGIQFHYSDSIAYAEKEAAPLLPTKDDFRSLQGLIEHQLAESKRIRRFTQVLCFIGIIILVLVWNRH